MGEDKYSPTDSVSWNRTSGGFYVNNSASDSSNSDSATSSSVADSAQINSQQTKAKKEADKEYIEKEFTTLQGSLVLMPSEETMMLKVGDIISLDGFGKNLSGAYYIAEIERTIDSSSGYSMTLTVVKTAFGGTVVKKEEKSSGERDKPATVSK